MYLWCYHDSVKAEYEHNGKRNMYLLSVSFTLVLYIMEETNKSKLLNEGKLVIRNIHGKADIW